MSPHSGFMCAFQFLRNSLGNKGEGEMLFMTTGLLILGAILVKPVMDWLRG